MKLTTAWIIFTNWNNLAFMLCHNNSVFQECDIVGCLSLHHHARAVSLEALFCQWGDRCLHTTHSHSRHSYNQNKDLRMSCSFRMRTYHKEMLSHLRLGRGLDFNSDLVPESCRFKCGDYRSYYRKGCLSNLVPGLSLLFIANNITA